MGEKVVVIKNVCSLKSKPEENITLKDELLFGMIAEIIRVVDDKWVYLKTHYNYEGYAKREFLMNTELKMEDYNDIVIGPVVDILKEPKYKSNSIITITRGSYVLIDETFEDKEWAKVILPDKQSGYVRRELVRRRRISIQDENIIRENIVKDAMLYMNTQYRWGGKSPLGIDCSGLTSISYMMNEKIIYRDAVLKSEFGVHEIKIEDIQKADLIYWKGHIGIYIGNDRYIHSTGKSGGTVINSLNPEHEDYREDLAKEIERVGTKFSKNKES